MFVNNKYLSWYLNIIASAQDRDLSQSTYVERHHILPKSLGGPDVKWNIVKLTGKEHFIAHKLLTKFTTGPAYYKMMHALWRMIGPKDQRERHRVSATEYERIKSLNAQAMSDARKGKATPAQLAAAAKRRGKPAHNKGVKVPVELRRKRVLKTAHLPVGQRLNLTPEQRAKRLANLAKGRGKGGLRPKFKTVLYNTKTEQMLETLHMKKTLTALGVNDRQFYSGNSGWVILEKYNLKTGQRLI